MRNLTQGSTFSALLSEMLDAWRWPQSPWVPFPEGGEGAPPPPSSPTHRRDHVATATLAAHPYRPMFLSGKITVLCHANSQHCTTLMELQAKAEDNLLIQPGDVQACTDCS